MALIIECIEVYADQVIITELFTLGHVAARAGAVGAYEHHVQIPFVVRQVRRSRLTDRGAVAGLVLPETGHQLLRFPRRAVEEVGQPRAEALVRQLERGLDLMTRGLDPDALAAVLHGFQYRRRIAGRL